MDYSKKKVEVKSDFIRISRDISEEEKAIVDARKVNVHIQLQKLGINCHLSNIPNIALLGSGGGLRAMIALQGVLGELQNQGLMDVVMHLCGVSGSTWCMSQIYEKEEWTKELPILEEQLCDKLANSCWDRLKAFEALIEPSKDDTFSLTDFWGSVIVYAMVHELDNNCLTEERTVSVNGKVPYPIYAAVDLEKLDDNNKYRSDMWFEFTPHEAGFFSPGAFVDMKVFGNKFKNGKLMSHKEEKRISYLRGLWGSAIADLHKDMDFIIDKKDSNTYKLCISLKERHSTFAKSERLSKTLTLAQTLYIEFTVENSTLLMHEDLLGNPCDKLRILGKILSCLFTWDWGTIPNYLYKYTDLDDKDLSDKEDFHLVDAGLAINSAYPLVLRPEREVKLILSFDFSDGDPFATVKQAAMYCEENQLPFPDINESELEKSKDNPLDCYVFPSKGNSPVVMHFPLFNSVNCEGDVADWRHKYSTSNFSYEEQEIKNLLEAAKINVRNNKEIILQEMKKLLVL
ncbi:cytosolic phospholipase A2 gamma-like [Elgaria multicarinata webbii]|uniref:cytosolic phospholipase A2 gamma-like n=1 Tax=Elgaria multicarinata webbii TaxID=159646 RepID=UPI002FCD62BD